MADTVSPLVRSRMMSAIRSKNTLPEMVVRRCVYGMGYRYRLHGRLPGKPDLVFQSRRKVIFVHGCYWHGHGCKRGGTGSKSNTTYWRQKIEGNRSRDARNLLELERLGWSVHLVWECEVRNMDALRRRLSEFLGPLLEQSVKRVANRAPSVNDPLIGTLASADARLADSSTVKVSTS